MLRKLRYFKSKTNERKDKFYVSLFFKRADTQGFINVSHPKQQLLTEKSR